MGCAHSKRQTYAIPINSDNKPSGESYTYRNPWAKDGLTASFKEDPKVKTIKDLYERAFEKFGENPFLGMRSVEGKEKFGSYKFKTYNEVKEISKQVGSAINKLDLAPAIKEDNELRFVGIWAKNCEQWIDLDIACSLYKIVSVPIYSTLGKEIVKYVVSQTHLTTIFCTADHIDELIEQISKRELPYLDNVVSFDKVSRQQKQEAEKAKLKLFSWEELLEIGKKNMQEPVEVNAEDLYTICYTSGTTGTPKGAMLSHGNQTASIAATLERDDLMIDENDSYFSYLPLAHCMERSGILYMISKGMKIGFSSGIKEKMMEDVQEFKPSIFFGVPKIYMKIYEGIEKKIKEQGVAKAAFIKMAIKAKIINLKLLKIYKHPVFDRLIFNKMREAMGGRLRYCATGAAPLDADILNYLRVVWCVPIIEGYGPTEGCAITFLTHPNDPVTGQVGGPMSCLEYKVIDDKEMKYTSEDKEGPRGEICFRGPCAFSGYYKNPEKTEENLDKEGWVKTGDIGMINKDGSLSVIDKKKSMFKLAQGEYVAGDKVEDAYLKCDLVDEIFVYGESSKSFLVSIVVPKKDQIEKLAKQLSLEGSYENNLKKPELRKKLLKAMDKAGKQAKLNGFEMVKQVYLESKSFKDNDLMTPTEKLKRGDAKNKFKEAIDRMYKDGPLNETKKS